MEEDNLKDQILEPDKIATLRKFAVDLGDEMNNLLIVISGRLQILANKQLDQNTRENLVAIDNCVAGLRKIVEKIRRFSMNVPIKIEEMDTNQVIEDALILLNYHKGPAVEIPIEKKLAQGLPLVKGDLKQLEEAFLLLFLNARKAMPEGGRLTVESSDFEGKFIEVRISDMGSKEAPHCAKKEWLGLDLLICYNIIHNLGGTIEIEGCKDYGTTFLVRLPI